MDSGSTTHTVRFVKCPRCRLILQEPVGIPVYKCGGCSTILQVKNRKNDAKSTRSISGSHEIDPAEMNGLDHVYEVTQSISSSQKECSLNQNNERDQKISADCNMEKSGGVNSSDENQNNESDHIESQDCNIEQPGVSNEVCTDCENKELSPLAGPDSEVEVNNESPMPAGEKSGVDINNESGSTLRSLNTDNSSVARMDINSTVTSHRPGEESISSNILLSSPDEQQEQLQPRYPNGDDFIRSNDPFDATNYFSVSSELSGTLEYMSKCPTTRSSHAYDGSVSSYDAIDDQVPNQQINSYKNIYKVLNSVVSEERSRTDNFLTNRNSELQYQARNFSPVLSDRGHYPFNCGNWGQDDLLESTTHGRAVRNGTRFERDKLLSSVPFHQRNYQAGYESGSASSQLHDEFHLHSSEQDKIKLLRMVYELQDKLNKKCYVNEKANQTVSSGVTMKEKYVPAYYSGDVPQEETFGDSNYYRHPERFRQGSNWSHQYNVSRIPFSGETTKNKHHFNSSCMHCYPQDWQCSAPLPPPILSHNKGFCRFHPGHSFYSSYRSCPSSPQQFTESEFPIWHRETKSDDQMHEDHMKKFMKEKHQSVKRHLRPTVGGAPFITCYVCLKPLQLPADFLLFKRRVHQLRCGACSEVLKFSLENKTHILPYTPNAVAPPPSEVDDYSDAVIRRSSAPSSHPNDYPHADPVSCSEDYGLSYCKSYSTDGDPVLPTTFHNFRRSADARDISYGSSDSLEDRKQVVLEQSRNKCKNPVATNESASSSSNMSRSMKVSSEIEELPAKTGSPLHRLMGYSSPSQVIRGSDPYDIDISSYYM